MEWQDELIFPELDADFLPRWQGMQAQELCSLTMSGSLSLPDRVTVTTSEPYSPVSLKLPCLERLNITSLVELARKMILHQKIKEVMFAKLQQAVYESTMDIAPVDPQCLVNDFIRHANRLNKVLEDQIASLAEARASSSSVLAKHDSVEIARWVIERYKAGIASADITALASRMALPQEKLRWLVAKRVERLNAYVDGKKGRPQWVPSTITDEQLVKMTGKVSDQETSTDF